MSLLSLKSSACAILAFTCCLLLMGPAWSVSAAEQIPLRVDAVVKLGSSSAIVNGKKMTIEPVYETKGNTMAPISMLIRAFNLDYRYDRSDKQIRLDTRLYELHHIALKLGEPYGSADGKSIKLPASPVERKGSIMVPLRGVAELLGGTVAYTASTKEIRITARVNPVIDAKLRIGDSSYPWSMSAPNRMTALPAVEGSVGRSFIGSYNKADNDRYLVTVKVTETNEDLTPEQLVKEGKTLLKQESVKLPAGEFGVISSTYNNAQPFSNAIVVNEQVWSLRTERYYYYITFMQEHVIRSESRYDEELNRIAHIVMNTFQTSIDSKDANQLDYAA